MTLFEVFLSFPAFQPNSEFYFVNLCIQSECGKMRTRKTPICAKLTKLHYTQLYMHYLCKAFSSGLPVFWHFIYIKESRGAELELYGVGYIYVSSESPHWVRMRKHKCQENSEYGHNISCLQCLDLSWQQVIMSIIECWTNFTTKLFGCCCQPYIPRPCKLKAFNPIFQNNMFTIRRKTS